MLFANRYALHEKIGAGGMGEVYRADDRLTGGVVAIKQITPLAQRTIFDTSSIPSDARLSLAQEFRTLASLRHPHIISVLDYGFHANRVPYFTMEYLADAQPLVNAGMAKDDVGKIQLIIELLQGLAYLHGRGVVHRDLKPSNVLVVDEQVKIIDFGLAVRVPDAIDPAGTIPYMAPEIFTGEKHTIASDLYAVGLIAYSLFARRYPFDLSQHPQQLIATILSVEADWELIPPPLQPVMRCLLAKSPQERYPTAAATIEALCDALAIPVPTETQQIRESFLQAAEFVGREHELDQFNTALAELENGQSSVWLIGGESGVGKTRLADEVRIHALVNGLTVLYGQAVPLGGKPFHIWLEPLRHLVLFTDISINEASVLKELIPDIGQLLQRDIPDAVPLASEASHQRLTSTIVDVFKRQRAPLVLMVEDLQWTIESLALLKRFAYLIDELKMLIIGTYRHEEAPYLAEDIPNAHLIMLERLDILAIEQLCQSMVGGGVLQMAVVDWILRETEGNTFFIVEMMRALAEDVGGLMQINASNLPTHKILPDGIYSLVQRRLGHVPQWGQPLLEWAAVAGRQLKAELLTAGLAANPALLPAPHTLSAWLTVCGEVAVLAMYQEQWQFAHDKLREGLLRALDPTTKRHLHQQVAAAIEHIYADDLTAYYADLVYHYHHAAIPDQECHYSYLAGRDAVGRFANNEALGYLDRALALLPADDIAQRFAVLKERERVHLVLGNRALQAADIEAMHILAEQLDDNAQRAHVAACFAEYYENITDLPNAILWSQRAIELAEPLDLGEIEARAYFWWGRCMRRQSIYDEAKTLTQRGLDRANDIGSVYMQSECHRHLGYISIQTGEFQLAAHHIQQAIILAQSISHYQAENFARLVFTEMLLYKSDYQRVYDTAMAAYDIARKIGDRWGEAWSTIYIGCAYTGMSRYWDAIRFIEHGYRICIDINDKGIICYSTMLLTYAYLFIGDIEQGTYYAAECISLSREINNRQALAEVKADLGWLAFMQNNPATALDHTAEGIELCRQAQLPMQLADALMIHAFLHLKLGDYATARAGFDNVLSIHAKHFPQNSAKVGDVWCALGYIAVQTGDFDQARTYIEQAMAHAETHEFQVFRVPSVIGLMGYEILTALQDPRAHQWLTLGVGYLNDIAANLPTAEMRERFWQSNEVYRQLQALAHLV